jgi:hypothetical protein
MQLPVYKKKQHRFSAAPPVAKFYLYEQVAPAKTFPLLLIISFKNETSPELNAAGKTRSDYRSYNNRLPSTFVFWVH